MNRPLSVAAFATVLLLLAPAAPAVETLGAEALRDHCAQVETRPADLGSRLCVGYINGFLDGAVATDPRVAENVTREFGGGESLTERAMRTRVLNRLGLHGPSYYAEFCVGQPVPLAEVVRKVVESLDGHDDLGGLPARDAVYEALRELYPCR